MSRGDSRLSSNSFSKTAHPLPGETGAGGGAGGQSIPSAPLSCPFLPTLCFGCWSLLCKRAEENHRHLTQKNQGENLCFQMKQLQQTVAGSHLNPVLPAAVNPPSQRGCWDTRRACCDKGTRQRYATAFPAFSRTGLMVDNWRDEKIAWKQKSSPQIYKICDFCYKLANRPICDR